MIASVEISNYRGFKRYRMEGLARVNLLVGKNNSGKTAILECAHLLASGGNPAVLADAAVRRGEVITAREGRDTYADLTHFFNGHELKEGVWFGIESDDDLPKLTVRIVRAKEVPPQPDPFDPEQELSSILVALFEGAPATWGQPIPISANGGLLLNPRLQLRFAIPPDPTQPTRTAILIPPDSLNPRRLAELWSQVILESKQESVLEALRIIEPELSQIIFLPLEASYRQLAGSFGIVAVTPSSPRPVPLGSMGDGMRRLLALAIAMSRAEAGALLIDEVDTGVHYSVMADMWGLVVGTAIRNGIQVFATTHSWDCVEGLRVLCKREPSMSEHVAVHKVDRALDHSVHFPGEKFVRAVEGGIELR